MTEGRLRILHAVRQFQPAVGGLETYVNELASRQAARHEVTVLTLNRVFGVKTKLSKIEKKNELTIVRIPFVGFRRFFLPLFDPRRLRQYDVVHIHGADQLLDVIAATTGLSRTKLFVTTHGLYFHTETLSLVKGGYFRTITRWGLNRVNAVFAVSQNDASLLEKIGIESILLRNPIVPLGNFICEGQDLLYVGRISANKRIELLIAFMTFLAKHHPSISLHIVGKDSESLWPGLSNDIVKANLQDKVHYHGFLDSAALIDVAKSCGFAVSAARYEGFGLSIVEGMSIGLLPFMHKNAAFQETFRLSGCGFLTNFDDPMRAAQDFANWFPRARTEDRQKAARYAHAQSWESAIHTCEKYYCEG